MQVETVTVYLVSNGDPVRVNKSDLEAWVKAGRPNGKWQDKKPAPSLAPEMVKKKEPKRK